MKFIAILMFTAFIPSVFAFPTDARLTEIQALANSFSSREALSQNVEIRENLKLPGPAWSFKSNTGTAIIEINPQIMNTLSPEARDFILFHELGHIQLHHIDVSRPDIDSAMPFELEADAFATFIYLKFDKMDQNFEDFLSLIESKTQTKPPGPERVHLIRQIIGAQ